MSAFLRELDNTSLCRPLLTALTRRDSCVRGSKATEARVSRVRHHPWRCYHHSMSLCGAATQAGNKKARGRYHLAGSRTGSPRSCQHLRQPELHVQALDALSRHVRPMGSSEHQIFHHHQVTKCWVLHEDCGSSSLSLENTCAHRRPNALCAQASLKHLRKAWTQNVSWWPSTGSDTYFQTVKAKIYKLTFLNIWNDV